MALHQFYGGVAGGSGAAVRGAAAMGFRGFNCSLPHKVTVIHAPRPAGRIGRRHGSGELRRHQRDGQLIGENTDGKGFLKSLATVSNPKGKSVVLFGAGGAARAIAVELALAGIAKHLTIVNRSEGRGNRNWWTSCPRKLNIDSEPCLPLGRRLRLASGTDIVINAHLDRSL